MRHLTPLSLAPLPVPGGSVLGQNESESLRASCARSCPATVHSLTTGRRKSQSTGRPLSRPTTCQWTCQALIAVRPTAVHQLPLSHAPGTSTV
jgi:hypothetical protein